MKNLLVILAVLALGACSGAGGAPRTIEEVRAMVTAELNTLAAGLTREDAILASQPIAPTFTMDGNVAILFGGPSWAESGIGKFREFFDSVFLIHSNIEFKIEIHDVELNGDVATVRAEVSMDSVRTDRTPPELFTATDWNYFVFELTDGAWLIRSWDKAPPHHDEGEGESL